MNIPKISVIMPAYNAEKYIAEAIDSILGQTYTDFEFIIINDGSTDKTEDIILSYDSSKIIYLKNEKNSGIVYTLNRGLNIAKGKYIARMDSDDIALPTRFEKQIKYIQKHPDIVALGTAFNVFGENIEEHEFIFCNNKKQTKAELFFSCALGHPSVMIRKSVIDHYNLRYTEEFKGLEDYYLWWQLSKYGELVSLKEPLLRYRKHPNQITASKTPELIKKLEIFLKERIEFLNIPITKSEFTCLRNYCLDASTNSNISDIKNLISLFKKALKSNAEICFFNQYYFKKVLGFALIRSINFLNLSKIQKFNLYRYALKENVFSYKLFLKLLLLLKS